MRARRRTANAPSNRVRPPAPASGHQQGTSSRPALPTGLLLCWRILRALLRWSGNAVILWGRTLACVPASDPEADACREESSGERWLREEATRGVADIERYLTQRNHRS